MNTVRLLDSAALRYHLRFNRLGILIALVSSFLIGGQWMSLRAQSASKSGETQLEGLGSDWGKSKYAMFIHYGLYSQAAGYWRGQIVEDGYSEQIRAFAPDIEAAEYDSLATTFAPSAWQADSIVALAEAAGMRSIVLTAKHHDGFCMYRTETTPYNVVQATPSGRDILGELAAACHRRGMKFGIYFSLIDWHYPKALPMSGHNADSIPPAHHEYNKAQIQELLTQYGPVSELWFDMGSLRPEQSHDLYRLVHNLQPRCRVSGRLGNGYSDFAVMADNELPNQSLVISWQTAASFYPETWGYRAWQQRIPDEQLIRDRQRDLVRVVARGGNYLLNIGPKGDGSVVEQEDRVLRRMGQWLAKHGQAIYNSQGISQYLPSALDIEATRTDSAIYLFFSPNSIEMLSSLMVLDSSAPEEALETANGFTLNMGLDRSPVSISSWPDGPEIPYAQTGKKHGLRIPSRIMAHLSSRSSADTTDYWQVVRICFDKPFKLGSVSAKHKALSGHLTADNATPQYGHYQWDYYTGHKNIMGYSWYAQKLPKTLTCLEEEMGRKRWITYNDHLPQEFVLTGGKKSTHHTNMDAVAMSAPVATRMRGTFGGLRVQTYSKQPSESIANDSLRPDLTEGSQPIQIDQVYTDSVGQISGVRLLQTLEVKQEMSLPVCLTFTNGIDVKLNDHHITTRLANRDGANTPTTQTILLHLSKGTNTLSVHFFNRFADRCAYGISFPETYTTYTIPLPAPLRKIPSAAPTVVKIWFAPPHHMTTYEQTPSLELRQ